MSTAPADSTAPPPSAEEGEGHLKRVLGVPCPCALRPGVHGAAHGVHHLRHRHRSSPAAGVPVAYLVTLVAMVFTAQVLRADGRGLPGRGFGVHLHAEVVRRAGRLPGGWSLLLDYLFLPMLNYLVIGHLHGCRDARGAARGCGSWSSIVDRDDPQHRRHRVGVVGQLRHHRHADRLHRRLRGDVHLDDLRCGRRQPHGAAHRRRHRRRDRRRSSRARRSCACPSSDSMRSPPCPRRPRTPNALCRRRS